MKLFEVVLKQHIWDDVHFGFMLGKGTIEAIFLIHQVQEKFLAKSKDR